MKSRKQTEKQLTKAEIGLLSDSDMKSIEKNIVNQRTNIDVDRPAGLKYELIRQSLQEMIDSGQYGPGDRFPSEQELAKKFGCNYHTIRRSMGILEDAKMVERRAGAGTFVLSPKRRGGKKASHRNVTASSTALGILCHVDMGAFGAEMIRHLHEQAHLQGSRLMICTVSNFKEAAQNAVADFVEQDVCAMVIPWVASESVGDIFDLVQSTDLPFVLPRPLPGLEQFCYERPDLFGSIEYEMMDRMYKYFERLGFGHIAFFGPDLQQNDALAHRLTAYSSSASRCGRETLIGIVGPDSGSVDMLVRRWEKFKGDLAVMCYDDDHAIRLLMSLHKGNLRIPEDVAVMGFNNTPQSVTSDPPLSTVQFDYDYVARSMIAHALAQVNGGSDQAQGNIRETLVIRESCGGRARLGDEVEALIANTKE